MTYFRPNVQKPPPVSEWLMGHEIPDLNHSIDMDDPERCETPPEFCMFVALVDSLTQITDIPTKLAIQHQVGRCRLDIAIIGGGKKINIEVDGESFHRDRVVQDRKRDSWLETQGWIVMRYHAKDLMIERTYACWAADDVRDIYLDARTLDEVRVGNCDFQKELERRHPRLFIPLGTCVSCRGTGTYEGEDAPSCDECDGSGKEQLGKRSPLEWIDRGWDWEEEWALWGCNEGKFQSIFEQ